MINDTLVAIFTCKKYAHRLQAQQETWIPEVRAAGFRVEVFDGERLGVPDGYEACVTKAKAIYRWTLDHGYKHLLKCDDDMYVWARNLRAVEDDYAGIVTKANEGGSPPPPPGVIRFDYASGGACWFSERSLQILSQASPWLSDVPAFKETFFSDRWDGQVLGREGIFVKPLPNYLLVGSEVTNDTIVLTQLVPDQIRECHNRWKT
jgi:hypothetical protein